MLWSHSLRVRGLKYYVRHDVPFVIIVALITSAWIEICQQVKNSIILVVALITSAWIEMTRATADDLRFQVALITSAWIEIYGT